MIDIEKFICSLLADHPICVTVREDIHKALKDQGLEYKGGKIVPIEDKTELKESEGERIRKMIINTLNRDKILTEDEFYDCVAWLEKQGEQKPADKVEPKFKVGDKIRKKTPSSFDRDMQVARIEKDYYVCNHIGKFSSEVVSFSKESSYELIEQKSAWSERDEQNLNSVLSYINDEYLRRWLKDTIYRYEEHLNEE